MAADSPDPITTLRALAADRNRKRGRVSGDPTLRAAAALDPTDREILGLLLHDGRRPMRDVAMVMDRAESTVSDRVQTLERCGLILGYEARVDWAAAGLPVVAVFQAHCPSEHQREMALFLEKVPNLMHALAMTGPHNLLAVARCRDTDEVRRLLGRLSATHLSKVHAFIMLQELVPARAPWEPAAPAMLAAGPQPRVMAAHAVPGQLLPGHSGPIHSGPAHPGPGHSGHGHSGPGLAGHVAAFAMASPLFHLPEDPLATPGV